MVRRVAVWVVASLVGTLGVLVGSEAVLPPPPAAALTPYEVDVLGSGPIGYWRFDDPFASGAGAVEDAVGSEDLEYGPAIPPGLTAWPGGAVLTDSSKAKPLGPNGYLEAEIANDDLYQSSTFTVEMWRYLAAGSPSVGLFHSDQQSGGGYILFMGTHANGALDISVRQAIGGEVSWTGPVVSEEEWHHIVVSIDTSSLTVYLDAAEVGRIPVNGGQADGGTANTWFHVNEPHTTVGYGMVDELAVYDRALRKGEVRSHYRSSGRTPPLEVPDDIDVPSKNDLCPECNPGQRHLRPMKGADPVDLATGSLTESFTDLTIPGRGPRVGVSRTYNSLRADEPGLFGRGWSTPMDMVLRETTGYAEITQENGAALPFERVGSAYVPPARVTSTLETVPGGWKLVRNKTDIVFFDSQGRVSKYRDQNGYETTITRTSSTITMTSPGGRSIVWTIGSNGLVSSVADSAASSRTVSYGYTDGRLTSVSSMKVNASDPTGITWGYGYDDTGLLESITDPRGNSNLSVYDSAGRVDHQYDYAGQLTDLVYTTCGSQPCTRLTAPAHGSGPPATTEYVFTDNLVTSMTTGWGTPSARTWTYEYHPGSYFLHRVRAPGGAIQTEYTYDTAGNVLMAKDAAGRTTTMGGYDPFNNPGTITDPAGNVASFDYDPAGNLEQSSIPVKTGGGATHGTAVTTYERTDAAHPEDVTAIVAPDQQGLPTPKKAEFSYRASDGQLAWSEDPEDNRTTYGYDSRGFVTSTVTPRGNATATVGDHQTTFVVNDFGMVQSVTDPLDEVSSQVYDKNGNVVSVTDANGQTTTTEYDDMNRPLFVHRADGSADETTTATTYYPNGAVHQQINGLGEETTYAYDVHGAVTSSTDANGKVTGYGYDPIGRLQHRIDPGGACPSTTGCTTYGYNGGNELTSVAYSDPATPDVTAVTYDALGQRSGVTRPAGGNQSWSWDNRGQLRSSTDANGRTTGYGWTLSGNLASVAYPGVATPVTYTYDAADRMKTVTDWASRVTQLSWTRDSQWENTTFPSGTTNVDTRTYDEAGRLASVEWKRGATSLGKLTYQRDGEGMLQSETPTGGTFSTRTWGYDEVDQLDQVDATAMDLDDAGNLVETEDGTFQVFDPAQQLCWTSPTATTGSCATPTTDATTYGHDDRGNRTEMDRPGVAQDATYGYDQDNRMTSAVETGEAPISAMTAADAVVGDFDGDASADVFWYHPGATQDWVSWGTPRADFGLDASPYNVNGTAFEPFTGDFDGDGHDDIFWYAPGATGDSVWFWFNNGVNDYTSRSFSVSGTYTPVVGDFDGDGFSDVYWYGPDAAGDSIWWGNANVDSSSSFTSQTVSRGGTYEPIAGDFDNNGVDDIFWYQPGTGAEDVDYGTGVRNSWVSPAAAEQPVLNGSGWDLATGDFDDDGKDDLFLYSAAGSQAWWGGAIGDLGDAAYVTWVTLGAGYQIDGGDLDGDGHADLLAYDPAGADTVLWGTTRANFGTTAHRGLTVDPDSATYTYGPDGLRNGKTVNGTTTQYTWNTAGGLPLLLSQHQGATATQIVYGPGGTPLYEVTSTAVTYYHHDHQGSTRLTTGPTGAAVARYAYSAYGRLTTNTAPTVATPLLGYTGQYTDTETGFIYLRARYMDPTTGQFTARDPLAPTTRSPYAYANSNPVMHSDPLGLAVTGACWSASGTERFYVAIGQCLLMDDDGNIAIASIAELGLGSPELSISGGGIISNADTVENLRGVALCGGGSTAGAPSVDMSACIGYSEGSPVPGNGVWSYYLGAGAAFDPGAAAHGGATFTGLHVFVGPAADRNNRWYKGWQQLCNPRAFLSEIGWR